MPESVKSNSKGRRPLRVLFVVLSLGVGGAEKLVYDIILHLSPWDVTPIVCCLDMIGSLGESLIECKIPVYLLGRRRGGIDWGLASRMNRIISDERIDVIHAHQYTPFFYGAISSLFVRHAKLIFTEHGRLYPDRRSWKRYLFNPLLAWRTDHIVSISESTKKAMVTYDNFPARRIEVIPNGVRFAAAQNNVNRARKRKTLGLDVSGPILGTAARLDKIKNLTMLLRVFQRILSRMPETSLLIAGKGPAKNELENLSEELGIKERVLFLGLRSDLPEIYPLLDVFALTSFTEGISITLLEAMAAGIPPVVTDVGGNSEVVEDGESGFLVPLGKDEIMVERIMTLLQSPERRKEMGASAAKRALNQFSFQRMVSSYMNLYQEKD